jgi:prephenate dehydrogenase
VSQSIYRSIFLHPVAGKKDASKNHLCRNRAVITCEGVKLRKEENSRRRRKR